MVENNTLWFSGDFLSKTELINQQTFWMTCVKAEWELEVSTVLHSWTRGQCACAAGGLGCQTTHTVPTTLTFRVKTILLGVIAQGSMGRAEAGGEPRISSCCAHD